MYEQVSVTEYIPDLYEGCFEFDVLAETDDWLLNLALGILNRAQRNQYLQTIDLDRIEYFEKLLGLIPTPGETLEERRGQIIAMWHIPLPYTSKLLLQKLYSIQGNTDVQLEFDKSLYRLLIYTHLDQRGQVASLETLLRQIIPINIEVVSVNTISVDPQAHLYNAVGLASSIKEYISTSWQEDLAISSHVGGAGVAMAVERIPITNDFRSNVNSGIPSVVGWGTSDTEKIHITT